MRHSRPILRLANAAAFGLATTMLLAGVVLAHPESEGSHPSGCVVTVEPGSVPVGGQFTVAGNFGGASIFLVKGVNASPPETAQPNATTPPGTSFSVTFIAEAADVGDWTVWGMIPETECADADALNVTAVPNTAVARESAAAILLGSLAVAIGVALGAHRLARVSRRVGF